MRKLCILLLVVVSVVLSAQTKNPGLIFQELYQREDISNLDDVLEFVSQNPDSFKSEIEELSTPIPPTYVLWKNEGKKFDANLERSIRLAFIDSTGDLGISSGDSLVGIKVIGYANVLEMTLIIIHNGKMLPREKKVATFFLERKKTLIFPSDIYSINIESTFGRNFNEEKNILSLIRSTLSSSSERENKYSSVADFLLELGGDEKRSIAPILSSYWNIE